jgi:hypothetical protein
MAVFFLRSQGIRAETLAWLGRLGGSPSGLPRSWRGDEGTWLNGATSERGGSGGFASRVRICMTAMEERDTELQRVDVLAFLGQRRSRVRCEMDRGSLLRH